MINAWDITLGLVRSSRREGRGGGGEAKGEKEDCLNVLSLFGPFVFFFSPGCTLDRIKLQQY